MESEMKKIRILHIVQSAGGVDRYIKMLLKYMDKEIFENVIVCSQDYEQKDYEDLVISFEKVKIYREVGLHDLKLIFTIRKLIRKYHPDIVYNHSSKAGAIGRIADIGFSNHCIYNPHGWAFNIRCSKRKKLLYVIVEKIASQFCELIICISNAEKQSALEKKICKIEKLLVICNGIEIDINKNKNVRRENLSIPEDAFIVGMVGRISPQKAPDIFIRTAKQIINSIPNAHFIIVGTGEQESEIVQYAKDNNFMNLLHITGWVDNPMDYINLFDVACLLSRWEGFGLVLPEYMLAKKPIVATRVDAIPEIIRNEENGLLVNVDDVKSTYVAIKRIYEDFQLKESFIKQGIIDVYSFYDIHRVAEEHQELFIKLCKEDGR